MKAMKIIAAALMTVACINGYAQGASAPASDADGATAGAASGAVSNRQLAASVRGALRNAHRHGLRSTYIRVRANGGVVTLNGVVADAGQIALAAQVAQGVPGVSAVHNKLQVRSAEGLKGSE